MTAIIFHPSRYIIAEIIVSENVSKLKIFLETEDIFKDLVVDSQDHDTKHSGCCCQDHHSGVVHACISNFNLVHAYNFNSVHGCNFNFNFVHVCSFNSNSVHEINKFCFQEDIIHT